MRCLCSGRWSTEQHGASERRGLSRSLAASASGRCAVSRPILADVKRDLEAASRAIQDFLTALGFDPSKDPELADTPRRVARAFGEELLTGTGADLASVLAGGTRIEGPWEHDIVVVRGLEVTAVCPHHLMPSVGQATVAYVPGARLLGLGALAKLVDVCSRRLVLQEQIGRDVATALERHAGAQGAFVRLELSHGCLNARTANASHGFVITTTTTGWLRTMEGSSALAAALSG